MTQITDLLIRIAVHILRAISRVNQFQLQGSLLPSSLLLYRTSYCQLYTTLIFHKTLLQTLPRITYSNSTVHVYVTPKQTLPIMQSDWGHLLSVTHYNFECYSDQTLPLYEKGWAP